jgi:O-antigen ligase
MKGRGADLFKSMPATAFLLLAILLGGASGQGAGAIANGILQIVSLFVILYCLWKGREAALPAEAKPLVWIWLLFFLLIVLSLIPLPAALWQQLPGRETAVRGLSLVGLADQSLPHSLTFQRTLASMMWLLPPAAAFLLVLRAPDQGRKLLVGGILIAALLMVVLGVVQLLSGPMAFRPYAITNPGRAVGMFANANHFATLLLCALPFSGYIAARGVRRGSKAKKASGFTLAVTTGLFLAIGVVSIGSLAGYGLLLVTAAAAALIYRRAAVGALSWTWIASVAALFLLFLGLAFAGPLQEQAITGKLSDQRTSRKVMAAVTVEAIKDSFPAGTGLGSFPQVYRTYENQDSVGSELVNHTHNDYLEFVLELGLPGLLLILAFIFWWISRTIHVWGSSSKGGDLGRAGSVVVLVVLLHSMVDYPIRTSAMAVFVAMACALMIPAWSRGSRNTGPAAAAESGDLRHLEAD